MEEEVVEEVEKWTMEGEEEEEDPSSDVCAHP